MPALQQPKQLQPMSSKCEQLSCVRKLAQVNPVYPHGVVHEAGGGGGGICRDGGGDGKGAAGSGRGGGSAGAMQKE